MAFTFTNYAAIKPQESVFKDLIGNLLSGYTDTTKARYLKPGLEEELKKAKLFNEYYGPNMESQMALRKAQTGEAGARTGLIGEQTRGAHLRNQSLPEMLRYQLEAAKFASENPLMSKTGAAGQIGALMYLEQHPELMKHGMQQNQAHPEMVGSESLIPSINEGMNQPKSYADQLRESIEASMRPKKKIFAPSGVRKLQEELQDIEAGYYPGSERSLPIESVQKQEELAAPYREHLGGLGKGEHYLYDTETHEKIGTQRPYTAKESEEEKGRHFFNEVFPVINTGLKDFVGKDSIKNFNKYVNNYGKNEEATRKIDDLLLAEKLMNAGVVKEAQTLGSGKTNMAYRNLAKTFPKSDIPELLEKYEKSFKIPGTAFMKAGIRFNEMLKHATTQANQSVPVFKTTYFHPEKYLNNEKEKKAALEDHEETITIRNKKTGKTETVSKAEARRRGIKNV